MKGVFTILVAAALGAAMFWAFQSFSASRRRDAAPTGALQPADREASLAAVQQEAVPQETVPQKPVGSPPASPVVEQSAEAQQQQPPQPSPPVLARRPVFSPQPSGVKSQASPVVEAPPPAQQPPKETSQDRAREPEAPAARPVPAASLEGERNLAKAAFDTGDRKRGTRLLEDLFAASKDRADVDLSPEVERLLDAETRMDRKRGYVQYLARFDRTGRVLDDQLARATKKTQIADESSEAAFAAWEDLSLAYEIAADRSQRKKVMAQLEPFIQRMVFSGRYTPILKSYTIQPGDSLSSIAAKLATTSDSIRRLNGLKSDVIQPRQRVRILPGKLKLFVDKSEFILWATLDGRVLFEYPVGLGRDNATPVGSFTIKVRQKDPSWWRPGEAAIPARDPRNILGTRWLGFKETQDFAGFGIHGTEDPSSLGKESSAGCVRLRNEDIEVLFDFVPYETEVVIRA